MKKYSIDMTEGPILRKLLVFTFPLICTYAMQTMFNAVDMMVVGRFCSHEALAAIGATSDPTTLVLKLFIGLSTGANTVIATSFGAREHVRFQQETHTSIAIAFYGGLLFTAIALLGTKPILLLMNTPENILHDSCMYMWIYFLGIPFIMTFNFCCAILRAMGNTRQPLYFLICAGVLNVLLNLLFVLVFRMGVTGVAIATTGSNGVAAVLLLRLLMRATDHSHINLKKVKIYWSRFREILWFGIPAAVNSTFYNIANMVIQTAVNGFGSTAVAGSAAASSVTGFVSIISMAASQSSMTIVAQNYGAKKYDRAARGCTITTVLFCSASLVLGMLLLWHGRAILGIFNSDPEVIEWGMSKLWVILSLLFLGCLQDVLCGCLRGVGHPVLPAVSSFFCACVFRLLWVFFCFPCRKTLGFLMLCFPISWILNSILTGIMLYVILKKLRRNSFAELKI